MDWEPTHADHSIDSVSVVMSLAAPIDANTFDELVVAGRKIAAVHQFVHRVDAIEPIQLQPQPGVQSVIFDMNMMTRRRVGFQRKADDAIIGEFGIGPTAITLASSRYSRWTPFQSMLSELMQSLNNTSPILDNVNAVQLQYIDSFNSTSVLADHFEIVSKESPFIPKALGEKERAFHCNTGWFDYLDDARRKLTNVNIGVVDNSPPAASDAMSKITILTMARMDALSDALVDPLNELSSLHDYLKKLFEEIITTETAARIALNN